MSYYDLAIIGNGYDLHYELPTQYENFYNKIKEVVEKKRLILYMKIVILKIV